MILEISVWMLETVVHKLFPIACGFSSNGWDTRLFGKTVDNNLL